MTSGCLDRKEVRGAIWGVHSTTDRPAGGNTGRLFLAFGGPVCADRISNCPLDRVLTYKNLIYLLNLQVCRLANQNRGHICVMLAEFLIKVWKLFGSHVFLNKRRLTGNRPGSTTR